MGYSENKLEYIQLYANYMLNLRLKNQVKAFVEGLHLVIAPEYLKFFFYVFFLANLNQNELQDLITGGDADIDIDDLRAHTSYKGYKDKDPYIEGFWAIVKNLTPHEKEQFLSFVTGTSRPPLLVRSFWWVLIYSVGL